MRDLAAEEDFSVLVVDVDPVAVDRLTEHGADGVVADLSDLKMVSKAVADADLVLAQAAGATLVVALTAIALDARAAVADLCLGALVVDVTGLSERVAAAAGAPRHQDRQCEDHCPRPNRLRHPYCPQLGGVATLR